MRCISLENKSRATLRIFFGGGDEMKQYSLGGTARQRIFTVLVISLHASQSHETDLENHRSKADELIGDDRRAVRLESLEEVAGNTLPQTVDEIDDTDGLAIAEIVQTPHDERVDGDRFEHGDGGRDTCRRGLVARRVENNRIDEEREDEADDRDRKEALNIAPAVQPARA